MADPSVGGRGNTRESYPGKTGPQALGPNTYLLGRYAVAKHGKSQLAIRGLIDAVLPSQKVQARHHKGLISSAHLEQATLPVEPTQYAEC
jgi:hypothetical protein